MKEPGKRTAADTTRAQRQTRRKTAAAQSTQATADGQSISAGMQSLPASTEEIRARAYEIYIERGRVPGNELDDWLQAEREHQQRIGAGALRGEAAPPGP